MPTPTLDPRPDGAPLLPPHPDAPHSVPPPGPRPAEPAPTQGADGGLELVPAGMIGELAYCPRLFTMQWLHDEFADNHHTVEGRMVHKRVDKPGRAGLSAPPPAHDPELDEDEDAAARAEAEAARPKPVRSVKLSDAALGLIAVCDVVEERWDGGVVPIDDKKGKAPDPTYVPEGAYEPERVQVARRCPRRWSTRPSAGAARWSASACPTRSTCCSAARPPRCGRWCRPATTGWPCTSSSSAARSASRMKSWSSKTAAKSWPGTGCATPARSPSGAT
jgi:hypothetical protein